MSAGLLSRMSGWLIAPAPAGPAAAVPAPPRAAAPAAPVSRAAVVAHPEAVHALAAAVALRLSGGTVVVGHWAGGAAVVAPQGPLRSPAAGRLAAHLAERGFDAFAAGRLVTVALSGDDEHSAAEAARLDGALPETPLVLAAGGPRAGGWDALLVASDAVVVHGPEPVLTELTVARLVEQGVAAVALDAAPGPAARAVARVGLAVPGALPTVAVTT